MNRSVLGYCWWCRAEFIWGWCSVWNNGAQRDICAKCDRFITHDYTGGTFDRFPDGRLKSEWAAAYAEMGL